MPGFIVDLSSNNHPGGSAIDWAQVKGSGVTTVFLKATEGTGYTNPFYASDMQGAQAAGLDTAAYHFASFGDPVAEANYFKSVAGNAAKILDAETNTNAGWQQQFLDQLGPQKMLYGSASSIQRQIPVLLWVAAYGSSPGDCACWQYTSTGTVPGIPGYVDLSQWLGTAAQYDAFIGTAAPEPLQDPQAAMFQPNPTRDTFNATIRYVWYTVRKDPIPGVDWFNLMWTLWGTPIGQPGPFGSTGFGGSWDLVVANIHDTAGANVR